MTKMLENAMVRPYADDDPIDEPQEPEYDKYLDSDEFYLNAARLFDSRSEPENLNATLRSIARSGSDIEALTKGLQASILGKSQGE